MEALHEHANMPFHLKYSYYIAKKQVKLKTDQ